MFNNLKPTAFCKGNFWAVSVRDQAPQGLEKLGSPSDIIGTGGCYGTALEDFIAQFDEYLDELKSFRDEVLESKRAYLDAVIVKDSLSTPLVDREQRIRTQAKIDEVVILVERGVVTGVYASNEKLSVEVLDTDTDDGERALEVEEERRELQRRIDAGELHDVY